MPDTKKYKLFKADPSTGAKAPCAFFHSSKGCRNGDTCKFSHELPSDVAATAEAEAPAAIIHDDSSDVVSSESEAETTQLIQITRKKKTKNEHQSPAVVKQQPKPASTNSNKKRKVNDTSMDPDLGLFTNPQKRANQQNAKKDVELPPPPKESTPKPKPSTPKASTKKKEKKAKTPVTAAPSFRSLGLPIASFSTDGKVHTPSIPKAPKEETTSKVTNKTPVPKSTPEGRKWQKAVLATRSNPKYEGVFNFDRMKETNTGNGHKTEWVTARAFGSWCAQNPHAIAIDCEMCETKCPESGNSDHKALCRLSVVNALNHDDVLIDTLVKPVWPVVDYRSRINGIKKEDLDNVQFTLSHAQAFMTALCSEETVILGHAVHNDLEAIKMVHHCNVDSALLFACKDAPNATCSLKDLAKNVMKKEMPNIHCSVNDARTALICIEEGYLKKDGKPDLVERPTRANRKSSSDLFVHRIPKGCKPEHIKNMFMAHTSIAPEEVPDLVFGSDTGKTTITFSSAEHASLAFNTLDGEEKPDKTGRMQKRIYLRNGDYLYIRKMNMDKRKLPSKTDTPKKAEE